VKILITEHQYKKLFLLEQGPPYFVTPGTGKIDQEARAKWEAEQERLKKEKEYLKNDPEYAAYKKWEKEQIKKYEKGEAKAIKGIEHKELVDKMEVDAEKYPQIQTDPKNQSQEQLNKSSLKLIQELEKYKEQYQSPWQLGSSISCFQIKATGKGFGVIPGGGINIDSFDYKGGEESKRKAYNKLSPNAKKIVDNYNIPAYVYTSLGQFGYNNKSMLSQQQKHTFPWDYRTGNQGWYNFLNSYYEHSSAAKIKENISKYSKLLGGPLNCATRDGKLSIVFDANPKGEGWLDVSLDAIGDAMAFCVEDYHCWLDVASIAALAIPGWGIFIAGGIDVINAYHYFKEASKMEPGVERKLWYVSGALTLIGAINPILKSVKIFKGGSRMAKEALNNFGQGYVKLTKSGNLNEKAVKKLYNKTIATLTNPDDIAMIKNYFKTVKSATPQVKRTIEKLEKLNRKAGVELQEFLKIKPNNFQRYLDNANGDLWKALDAFRRTKAGYEALVQTGLFVGLGTVLPPLVVKTYKWYQEEVKKGNYGGRHIKTRVIASGFPWEDTKDIFGAISTDDPNYTKEKSEADNTLLKDAWEAGWRPWDPEKKDEEGRVIEIPVPEEFWTDEYRNRPKIGEWFDIEDPETLEQLKKLINNEEFDEEIDIFNSIPDEEFIF